MARYWITPPHLSDHLNAEFAFDFDPCPYPRPDGHDALTIAWGRMNYVNPPYRRTDGNTHGPTAFVRKAIAEQQHGRSSVLLLPVQSYINLLLESGAELRAAGRTRFLDADTMQPMKASPSPTVLAILRGAATDA